ncbi:hypothetical protein [Pigmentiphaga litoralis]|uniref:hypothetical protein n=1 Tax=Pigmentiphaga litoralis TaxID=516702 RepID=UPI003B4353B9
MMRGAGGAGASAAGRAGLAENSRFGRMTLKQRVTWALTGAVALFVALQAALVYLVLDEQEDALVDQIVTTEATRLVQRLTLGEVVPPASGPLELGPSLKAWVAPPGVRMTRFLPASRPCRREPIRSIPMNRCGT